MNATSKRTTVTCLVVLLSTVGHAAPSFEISPANPTASDVISVLFSGTWRDSCVPEQMTIQVVPSESVSIDLLLPGWDVQNPDNIPMCLMVLTPWSLMNMIGSLASGTYDVYVREVGFQSESTYAWSGQFQVADTPKPASTTSVFAPGQRVVLLEDHPPGGVGLMAGHAVTVICCDSANCSGSVLVSWDLWTYGLANAKSCVGTLLDFCPPNSAMWVNPNEVAIGRDFSGCGTIARGLEGCVVFKTDEGATYNVVGGQALHALLSGPGRIRFGDRVRVRGALDTILSGTSATRICPQHDGDLYHPIVSPCVESNSGPSLVSYRSGDRAASVVDDPTDSVGPPLVPGSSSN